MNLDSRTSIHARLCDGDHFNWYDFPPVEVCRTGSELSKPAGRFKSLNDLRAVLVVRSVTAADHGDILVCRAVRKLCQGIIGDKIQKLSPVM